MALILESKHQLGEYNVDDFLYVLADNYCRKILSSIEEKPKSCTEISIQTNVPISSVYRRIQSLTDLKLVVVMGSISEDGKKFFLYKSRINCIDAHFDKDVKVEITFSESINE